MYISASPSPLSIFPIRLMKIVLYQFTYIYTYTNTSSRNAVHFSDFYILTTFFALHSHFSKLSFRETSVRFESYSYIEIEREMTANQENERSFQNHNRMLMIHCANRTSNIHHFRHCCQLSYFIASCEYLPSMFAKKCWKLLLPGYLDISNICVDLYWHLFYF